MSDQTKRPLAGCRYYFFKCAPDDQCRFKTESGDELTGVVNRIVLDAESVVYVVEVNGGMRDVADGDIILSNGE